MEFPIERHSRKPTRIGALIFYFKTRLLQLRRMLRDLPAAGVRRYPVQSNLAAESVAAESRSPLWSSGNAAERLLQAGKIHNLRLAVRRLDGVEIPAGEVFSFWKQIGMASRWKGYARGRELREGCIIPNIGGGLCQLSNALYDAALKAGCTIIERHAHTQVIPGSLAESGRDATVFWNYVDLRFSPQSALRIEARLSDCELIVQFKTDSAVLPHARIVSEPRTSIQPDCCASCGVNDCFRAMNPHDSESKMRPAFLVDELWPEFDAFIQKTKAPRDLLALPIDGKKHGRSNYAWSISGFGRVVQHRLFTAWRAAVSRRLGAQGAERQRALLRFDEKLARTYARLLTHEVTHVVVAQNLLPFLWRDGHLGGRTFDVMMTRLPIAELHRTLDRAAALHPESPTLADFRAPDALAQFETEALRNAHKIITPHTYLAAMFPEKAVLLDWQLPPVARVHASGAAVVFPASTLGRKGAYEVREAARQLGVPVISSGAELEGGDFWRGVQMQKRAFGANWLEDAGVVVLPAFVEHKPRRLLEAAAGGITVIASEECGLCGVKNVITIPSGDVDALAMQIQQALGGAEFSANPESKTCLRGA